MRLWPQGDGTFTDCRTGGPWARCVASLAVVQLFAEAGLVRSVVDSEGILVAVEFVETSKVQPVPPRPANGGDFHG